MQAIRDKINSQSVQTKQKLLCLYIFLILCLISLPIFQVTISIKQNSKQHQDPYINYVNQYAKKYSPVQQTYRRFIFYQTYNDIIFHNKKQIDQSYVKGINQFADLTKEEFQELYHIVTQIAVKKKFLEIADFAYDSYDWSQKHLAPTIKNSRSYDVGHIFATVQLMQFWVNKLNKPNQSWISLSQQEIIDCCDDCGVGAQPHNVIKYVIKNGISSNKQYPYTSSIDYQQKNQCKTKSMPKPFKPILNYQKIKNCPQLSLAIQKSPVIVGIDATQYRDYLSGIVQNCGTKRSHYMLLVGKGIGYWKLKNSWGPRWGERGYMRIKLGNTCAICLHGYTVEFNQNS